MRNPPTPNPGKSGQNDQRPPNQRSSGTSQVLPDEAYALNQEVSAGELDASGLRIDSTSTHRIDVRLTAGGVTLSSDGDEQF